LCPAPLILLLRLILLHLSFTLLSHDVLGLGPFSLLLDLCLTPLLLLSLTLLGLPRLFLILPSLSLLLSLFLLAITAPAALRRNVSSSKQKGKTGNCGRARVLNKCFFHGIPLFK
jgi:hypothetical protein